jgi:hypothetical protein
MQGSNEMLSYGYCGALFAKVNEIRVACSEHSMNLYSICFRHGFGNRSRLGRILTGSSIDGTKLRIVCHHQHHRKSFIDLIGNVLFLPINYSASLILYALPRPALMSFRFQDQPELSSGKRLRQVCGVKRAHKMSFAS